MNCGHRHRAILIAILIVTLGGAAVWNAAAAATLIVDSSGTRHASGKTFQSITAALSQLQRGDTLVIAPGIYRESIDLRLAHGLSNREPNNRSIIIKSLNGNSPLIEGSDVVSGLQRVGDNVYVKHSWPHNSQQVFVDGVALKQIGGVIFNGYPLDPKNPMAKLHQSQGGIWPARIDGTQKDLVDNSFYYDTATQSLYVRSTEDLSAHKVEASVRPYLLISNDIDSIEIHGLKFMHANTTSESQSGAIAMTGNHLLLDRVTVTQVDGNGIDITGDDNQVRNSITNYCGIVGLKVRGHRARVIGNETSFNNTRGFNKWWEAGGAKFVGAGGLQDSEVAYNKAFENHGDGLWFDWHNHNNRIHDNVVAYNSGMGIQYEASEHAFIYDNYVFANGQRGIYLPNVSGAVVAHNVVVANKMEGIAFIDERHAAQNGPEELIPRNNRVVANVVAWNGKTSVALPLNTNANDNDNRSDANVFLDHDGPTFSLGWGSREHPVVRGLEAWRKISQQDELSTWQALSMPTGFEQQLQTHQLNPDWQWLKRATEQIHTPTLSIVDTQFTRPGSPPGPSDSPSHPSVAIPQS